MKMANPEYVTFKIKELQDFLDEVIGLNYRVDTKNVLKISQRGIEDGQLSLMILKAVTPKDAMNRFSTEFKKIWSETMNKYE